MSGITIGRAALGDCQEIRRLTMSCPELVDVDSGRPSLRWVESFVREPQSVMLAAKDGNEIVGFANGERTSGDTGLIWMLYVRDSHRRRGLGGRLFSQMESILVGKLKVVAVVAYGCRTIEKILLRRGYAAGNERYREFVKLLERQ